MLEQAVWLFYLPVVFYCCSRYKHMWLPSTAKVYTKVIPNQWITTIMWAGHAHTEYVSEREITELKNELNGKIEAVRTEWEMKQQVLDNEESFWKRAILSLAEMLHSATSGKSSRVHIHITSIHVHVCMNLDNRSILVLDTAETSSRRSTGYHQ